MKVDNFEAVQIIVTTNIRKIHTLNVLKRNNKGTIY